MIRRLEVLQLVLLVVRVERVLGARQDAEAVALHVQQATESDETEKPDDNTATTTKDHTTAGGR